MEPANLAGDFTSLFYGVLGLNLWDNMGANSQRTHVTSFLNLDQIQEGCFLGWSLCRTLGVGCVIHTLLVVVALRLILATYGGMD